MTNLTIRIEESLKKKAAKEAAKLGIPLTFVVKNALINFVKAPKVVIGEPETVVVDESIQNKMDKIADLL